MNSDELGKPKTSGSMNHHHESVEPNADSLPKPLAVPVFNCVIYVSRNPAGGVRARVANLSGLECTADSEREALGKLVTAFKDRIVKLMQSQSAIPWIEPPPPVDPGEQQRLIAVHL